MSSNSSGEGPTLGVVQHIRRALGAQFGDRPHVEVTRIRQDQFPHVVGHFADRPC